MGLNFLPLPIVRPERVAISGDNGLLAALEGALAAAAIPIPVKLAPRRSMIRPIIRIA